MLAVNAELEAAVTWCKQRMAWEQLLIQLQVWCFCVCAHVNVVCVSVSVCVFVCVRERQ